MALNFPKSRFGTGERPPILLMNTEKVDLKKQSIENAVKQGCEYFFFCAHGLRRSVDQVNYAKTFGVESKALRGDPWVIYGIFKE